MVQPELLEQSFRCLNTLNRPDFMRNAGLDRESLARPYWSGTLSGSLGYLLYRQYNEGAAGPAGRSYK